MQLLRILEWIIGKGEKEEPFEVEFSNLSEWLWKFVEGEAGKYLAEYGILLKKLKEKIDLLDKLSLDKEEVEKKLKELVKGNKPAYTNSLRILIKKIESPPALSSKNLKEFCENTEGALDEFNKRTARNYAILKTIIGKELAEIVDILKQLEALEVKLKKDFLLSSKLSTLEDIRSRLAFFYEMELSKGQRNQELMNLNKKRELLVNEIANVRHRLDSLKKSDEFYEYERLNIRMSGLGAEELKLKGTLSAAFSEISRPLRKLDKESRLLAKYSEDPYLALMEDNKLEILSFIAELRSKIDSGKIEVKNKNKILGETDALITSLKNYQEKIEEIPKELKTLQSKLASNKFENDESELTTKFRKLENELSDLMAEIGLLEDNNQELNLIKITKDIEKLAGRKVVVRNAPIM